MTDTERLLNNLGLLQSEERVQIVLRFIEDIQKMGALRERLKVVEYGRKATEKVKEFLQDEEYVGADEVLEAFTDGIRDGAHLGPIGD